METEFSLSLSVLLRSGVQADGNPCYHVVISREQQAVFFFFLTMVNIAIELMFSLFIL